MKRTVITALIFLLIGLGIGYLLFLATGKSSSDLSVSPSPAVSVPTASVPSESATPTEVGKEMDLLKVALTAANLIKTGSYDKLSEMVHPEDGVYFIPYSYIDLSKDMHFTADQVANFATDETAYLWGYTDGEGAPINRTPNQYFEKYVYDEDYITAPVIGRNYIVKTGNSIENVQEVFPDCQFVDFHFPGFDAQVGGMDWCTLRLVFREYEGSYKIVAIIHAQWTI